MSRINSKNKGNKNERDLCKAMKTWSSFEFSRVPQSGGLRWRKTENTTGDLICSDDRHKQKFKLSIETKFHTEINFQHLLLPNGKNKILEFWEQAKSDAKRGNKIPILFMRYNGMPKLTWFTVISSESYSNIREFFPKHVRLIFRNKDGEKLVLLNSSVLFESDYKQIHKAI